MISANQQARVMIIDDVPDNLNLLNAILSKENFLVEVFTNGPDALQSAAQNPPDIILLDIAMPEMDGYEVCEKLKADEKLRRIPVLFISALSDVQEKVKGFDVGGQDYITKPFQLREVVERVKTHLDLAWTRRELEETLDQTLTGSIKLITDFMAFANPFVFSRAIRIKENMMIVVERLNLTPPRWFELAAILSQFGPAALPQPLQEKISTLRRLDAGEKERIDHAVRLLEGMIRNIPRLEPVADMIAQYQLTLKRAGRKPFNEFQQAEQGGMILNMLYQYDQLLLGGRAPQKIVDILRSERNFPDVLYTVLQEIAGSSSGWITRYCCLSELNTNMILQEDIQDVDGRILLKRGIRFSKTITEALRLQQERLLRKKVMVKARSGLY